MVAKIDDGSKEYVRVPAAAAEAGVTVDPTLFAVRLAVVAQETKPVSGDWKTASWEASGSAYFARMLVGPGGAVDPTVGAYDVWIEITGGGEVVKRMAGPLYVT